MGDDGGARLSAARIEEAAARIDAAFTGTPQFESDPLGAAAGARVLLKVETATPIRSFKGRGADWFVQRLLAEEGRPSALVCASAGNFGQGVAWAARRHALPVVVFAAEGASARKVEAMRALGADVRLAGADFDAAKDAARAHAEAVGARFVEDGREVAVAEGAGTIAVELATAGAFDLLLAPLGNGALLAGMATWLKARRPSVRVVGVCAAGAPAMALSLRAGRPVTTARVDTVADGIAVRVPVPEAIDDLRGRVDDVLLVEEPELLRALRVLFQAHGLIAEPAGAAGIAALLAHAHRFAGARVAIPVCGGNLTDAQLRRWLGPDAAPDPAEAA